MDDILLKAEQVVDEAVDIFLEKVNRISENGPFRKNRKKHSTFSMLQLANDTFYEYAFFERTLEWYVRDDLINTIILGLFKNHGIGCSSRGYLWPESKGYSFFGTESIENVFPFEFVFVSGGKTMGVRYTGLCDEEADELIEKYAIKRIIQIKWDNDLTSFNKEQTKYEVVTPEIFFSRYLTPKEYDIFISKVMDAVEKANTEIGFETIPHLSLRYLSDFKAEVDKDLSEIVFEEKRYQVLSDSNDREYLTGKAFDEQDYNILNNNFKKRGLYKALLGTEGFAKCFITAEYQYQVFQQGHNFDYTSVVCGYLKAVEQLIYKLLLINLDYPSLDKLWIMKNSRKIPKSKFVQDKTVRQNPETEKLQVIFTKEFKDYFNFSLVPMIWFLYDNVNGWEISEAGRSTTCSFLRNFADECRNDHFHRDNINDFCVVERIRNNAILIIFLLLGGYKLTGDDEKDMESLGIINDSFDRLYKKIQKLPGGMKKFVICFPEKSPIKAYRHFTQEKTNYDENGSLALSKIKFVEVDKFSADEYSKAMEGKYVDKEFTLDPDNMPSRISYINGRNEEISIEW